MILVALYCAIMEEVVNLMAAVSVQHTVLELSATIVL